MVSINNQPLEKLKIFKWCTDGQQNEQDAEIRGQFADGNDHLFQNLCKRPDPGLNFILATRFQDSFLLLPYFSQAIRHHDSL